MNPWKYADELTEEELISGGYVGFVYAFHFEDGSWYVGSKQMYKRVKDTSKLKDTSTENGWRDYSSSSKIVNAKIEEGIEYTRTILWPFTSMKETLLVEAALIMSVGLHPSCINLALMHKVRLPNAKDRRRLYGVIQEIQGWLT